MDLGIGLFRQLMQELWQRNESFERGREQPEKVRKIREVVSSYYLRIENDKVLDDLLPTDAKPRVSFGTKYLYLEPIVKGIPMQPMVWIECDLDHHPIPKISLRLSLFLLDEGESPQSIGYRFETPEGESGSTHHYYHSQMITGFARDGDTWCSSCRVWLPETQPAFALDAKDPVTMLVCLLVSLYGINEVGQIVQAVNFSNELKKYVEQMAWHDVSTRTLPAKKQKKLQQTKSATTKKAAKKKRR